MADKGAMDKAKGKVKEATGKATGNDRMAAEGKIDQAKGKTKESMADAKDALHGKHRKA
ncbi:CsbD family protein [Streptomyces sp. G-G2]|uniref:CsbD family protein n=1 Tax=Streptomyces sp. G-G2 TaxID=3046201 RepID=UPI0024BBBCB0|nr:CsbD family protein [Streptomyces sp. G-G2]MDJ0386204.1 CsbD family protein [Streptomyces sp. G-G2]